MLLIIGQTAEGERIAVMLGRLAHQGGWLCRGLVATLDGAALQARAVLSRYSGQAEMQPADALRSHTTLDSGYHRLCTDEHLENMTCLSGVIDPGSTLSHGRTEPFR